MNEETFPISVSLTMPNIAVVTVDDSPVLKPFPLSAFLPPQTTSEMEIVRFILAGVAGVSVPLCWVNGGAINEHQAFVWDILNNIREDYIFVAGHTRQCRWPIFIYFLSKCGHLFFVFILVSRPILPVTDYVLWHLLYFLRYLQVSWKISRFSNPDQLLAAPISSCFYSEKALTVLFCLANSLTSLLFVFRACAVFSMNPCAVSIFGVLWLGVLGGCLTTIPGSSGANIGPTLYCTHGVFKLYSVAATLTPLISDGIVFFAISWRLWSNTWTPRTVNNGIRVLVFGDYLPAFSRSLLRDGQIYFLSAFLTLSATSVNSIFHRISVCANLLTMVMAFSTGHRSVPIF